MTTRLNDLYIYTEAIILKDVLYQKIEVATAQGGTKMPSHVLHILQ